MDCKSEGEAGTHPMDQDADFKVDDQAQALDQFCLWWPVSITMITSKCNWTTDKTATTSHYTCVCVLVKLMLTS